MKLVNLKLEPKEKKEMEVQKEYAGPDYPWGLTVNLEEDSIGKLGLPALPAAGETMLLHARVKVTTAGQRDDEERGKMRSLALQITDMALEADKPSVDPKKAFYGKE